jgi:hypothetical protein
MYILSTIFFYFNFAVKTLLRGSAHPGFWVETAVDGKIGCPLIRFAGIPGQDCAASEAIQFVKVKAVGFFVSGLD